MSEMKNVLDEINSRLETIKVKHRGEKQRTQSISEL